MEPADEIWFAGGELTPPPARSSTWAATKGMALNLPRNGRSASSLSAVAKLPRAVIEKVGYLDETLFMYCEDVDYCIRLARAGVLMWFCPTPSSTTGRRQRGRMLSVYYITRNTLYLTRKGKSAAYKKLKTVIPILTGAARYALTKALGRKRPQLRRVQRCTGLLAREDGENGGVSGRPGEWRRGEGTPPYNHL